MFCFYFLFLGLHWVEFWPVHLYSLFLISVRIHLCPLCFYLTWNLGAISAGYAPHTVMYMHTLCIYAYAQTLSRVCVHVCVCGCRCVCVCMCVCCNWRQVVNSTHCLPAMTTLNGEYIYIHIHTKLLCTCTGYVCLWVWSESHRYPAAIDLLSLRFVWCMEVKTSQQEGNTCLNELYTVHSVSVLQLLGSKPPRAPGVGQGGASRRDACGLAQRLAG